MISNTKLRKMYKKTAFLSFYSGSYIYIIQLAFTTQFAI